MVTKHLECDHYICSNIFRGWIKIAQNIVFCDFCFGVSYISNTDVVVAILVLCFFRSGAGVEVVLLLCAREL